MRLSRLLLILAAFCLAAGWSSAQVTATLVGDETSIQPGRPFTVALRLEHQAHWHTYWINPGTGYATSIAWTLPAGWKAGEIHWPTPIVIRDRTGATVGNGYDGDALLPVTITPPADAKPGETVTLKAKADWLMCENACVPGGATVELSLPVRAEEPAKNETWHKRIAELPMPRAPQGWNVSAVRDGKTIRLTLTSAGNSPARPLPNSHFFSEDGLIDYEKPQTEKPVAGGYEWLLSVSDSAEAAAARLVGVLATQPPLAGLRIDVLLSSGNAAAAASQPASGVGGAAQASGGASGGSGLSGLLLLAFVGGMILNLMPCVFPVLGIKILGFVNQAGADRRKVTLHGLVFTSGVLASFWALAGVLAILRAGGSQLGWGFQLQSPVFVFALATVMLVFALSMSGLFEIGLRATAVGASLQSKSGYAGSFFTGVLATVVATPCSAPFLAPALGAAVTMPAAESFAVFTAIAVGLSTPYLVLSMFPSAVKVLPRPGAWMETFKQVMAFPLYATVAYLVWVLAGQTKDNDYALLSILFGLTLIALAGWLYGRTNAPGASSTRANIGAAAALLIAVFGLFLGWPRAAKATDIAWEPWTPQRVAELRAQNRVIYVDFTARWCATCQANKKLVFGSDEVKRLFHDKKIATLKGDWTNRDPKITEELARWGRSAVPFNLVYKPGQTEPVVLPELLTASTVLQALK
ncbi:hypothetical protein DB347_04065 [Opitutaceae bacterium EW11]|nr:hypothetical protein DB347_04065 [Opitutaceae bacterium EW11]